MTTQKPPDAKPPKRRRTWKQRLKITFWIVVAVAILFRLSLSVLLPVAIRRAAAHYGLQCRYDRIELSLLGGDANIWGLDLKPAAGGNTLIQTEYARAKIKPWKLLLGKLDIERLEADGADLFIDREASGKMPLLETFLKSASSTAAAPSDKPIDLSAPLKVDATRVTHLRAHFRDAHVSPQFETTIALDLRITDMGSPDRPTQFEATLAADKLVDVVRFAGDVKSSGRTLDAHFSLLVRGLKLKPVAAYLAPWGIRPNADDISVKMQGHIVTAPAPSPALGVRGTLTLDDLAWSADNVEQFGLDQLTLQADNLDSANATFSHLLIDGLRARIGRTADGYFSTAGIDFIKAAAAPAPRAAPAPAASAPASTFRFALAEFGLKNVKVLFHDQAVTPPADLAISFDSITAKSPPGVPLGPGSVIDVAAAGSAPGVAGNLSARGTLTPLAAQKHLAVTIAADDIKPVALKPYLDALGLKSTLVAGKFITALDASIGSHDGAVAVDAQLAGTQLTDQGKELGALKDVRLKGVVVDPETGRIRAGAIEIHGPDLSVRRNGDGSLSAMGLRTVATLSLPASGPPPTRLHPAAAPGSGLMLPRIEIGHFLWDGIHLNLEDATVNPPTKIALTDAGVQIDNLLVDLDAAQQTGRTGKFKMWAAAPGVIGRLTVDGTLTPGERSLAANCKVGGAHIDAARLAAYLAPLRIEPTLRDGNFACDLTASARQTPGGVVGDLAVSAAMLADGSEQLASLTSAAVKAARVADGALKIDAVDVVAPKLSVTRDAAGAIGVCGVKLLPAQNVEAAAGRSGGGAALPRVMIGKFEFKDAALAWADSMPAKPVRTTVSASGGITGLDLGGPGLAQVKVAGKVAGAVDDFSVAGAVGLDPADLRATLAVEAGGVRAGSLEGYVPAGLAVTLTKGVFKADVDAAWKKNPAGGNEGALQVANLSLADGGSKMPLIVLRDFDVTIDRYDMPARVIEIGAIRSDGLQADIHRDRAGQMEAGGLRFTGEVPAPVARTYQKLSLQGLPLVKIQEVALAADRVGYIDDALGTAVTVRDVSLATVKPIECLGRDAATLPPAKFTLKAALDPVATQVDAEISLAPFAAEPLAAVQVDAAGVNGKGLATLVPLLNEYGEVGGLTAGTMHVEVGAVLKLDRRSPLDFDFSRPFGATAWMKGLAFCAAPGGPVVAGVKDIEASGVQVNPASRLASIKTLEITEPIGRASLTDKGIEAMGMLFRFPQQQGSATQGVATQAAAAGIAAKGPAPAPWELRIGKLLVSGIDAQLSDTRVSPPFVIPLNSLDMEASNLSSKALTEPQSIRFSLLANAGKVSLGGAGTGTAAAQEQDLFSQATGSGKLAIYPHPKGWVKLSLSGMELGALRAEAKREGIDLAGGEFDATVDARFHGDGTGRLQMRLVLTDMRLAERAGGPIQRFLKLPTPLNAVIGMMEDPDGSITIPLTLSLSGGQLSPGTIVAAIPGAIARVMTTAIASAPLKLLGMGAKKAKKLPPVTVAFAPGVALLDAGAREELETLAARMKSNKRISVTLTTELGEGDVTREAERANPTTAEARSMVAQLRERKARLQALRAELTGRAEGQIASGAWEGSTAGGKAGETLSLLRAIDRSMAQSDDALDAVADLLKPGADRQAGRRARAAALQLARERLDAVRSLLVAAGIPDAENRIQAAIPSFKPAANSDGGTVVVSVVQTR